MRHMPRWRRYLTRYFDAQASQRRVTSPFRITSRRRLVRARFAKCPPRSDRCARRFRFVTSHRADSDTARQARDCDREFVTRCCLSHAATSFDPRHSTNGTSCAPADLERKADELESAQADQQVQIVQAFHMGKSHIPADVVHLEIIAPWSSWTHGLYAKHVYAAIAQPRRRLLGKAREIRDMRRRSYCSAIQIHVQEDRIFRLYLYPGGFL